MDRARGLLLGAADYCRKLTRKSQSNFYYAFLFLPPRRREALYTVYAYCRLIDDIVDGDVPGLTTLDQRRTALCDWREDLVRAFSGEKPTHPVAQKLQEAHREFGLRHEDALAILTGCEMDLTKSRYATFADLRDYCYHVASAVGLLCIEIFGHTNPGAREYAIELGLALQLTNILRDVAEDARRGRIYLPQEDLRTFGVSEEDLLGEKRTDRLTRLLRFQAERAEEHYRRARAALPKEDRRTLVIGEIMGDIYHALLRKIVRGNFPVFQSGGKVVLRRRHKMAIALLTYGRSKLAA